MKKLFLYLEPLWIGTGGKISIRRTLSLMFSIDLLVNFTWAYIKWTEGKSIEGLTSVLTIQVGFILVLLGLTTYTNTIQKKIDAILPPEENK